MASPGRTPTHIAAESGRCTTGPDQIPDTRFCWNVATVHLASRFYYYVFCREVSNFWVTFLTEYDRISPFQWLNKYNESNSISCIKSDQIYVKIFTASPLRDFITMRNIRVKRILFFVYVPHKINALSCFTITHNIIILKSHYVTETLTKSAHKFDPRPALPRPL